MSGKSDEFHWNLKKSRIILTLLCSALPKKIFVNI